MQIASCFAAVGQTACTLYMPSKGLGDARGHTHDEVIQHAAEGSQCHPRDWPAGLRRADDIQKRLEVLHGVNH